MTVHPLQSCWIFVFLLGTLASCSEGKAVNSAPTVVKEVRDFEYLDDMYFFLDDVYREAFRTQIIDPRHLVDVASVRVYLNDFNNINDLEDRAEPALAYASWNDDGTPDVASSHRNEHNGGIEEGSFHELTPQQDFIPFENGYVIMIRGRVSSSFALGVAYRTRDGRMFGDVAFIPGPRSGRMELKLIKARNQQPHYPTWPLVWRNVYGLGMQDVSPEDFEVRIFKEVPGQEPVDHQDREPYLIVFGLDRHINGASPGTYPDGRIDIDGGRNVPGVHLLRGHLVFPDLEPFGAGELGAKALKDPDRVPIIYRTANPAVRAENSRFFMQIQMRERAVE